ncbi:hypothetical protein BKA70DRAFT_1116128 [Coprinopsis sp. MPI-PUGE-AT-0042]|nr:hypothetical protein BKA70DRAFT_1116128 [Coprinopsis sp. MPI-PUGE-AT-0042]
MPLARLVSFRRISSAVKGPPQHDKKPLLHLNLSSQSFLDSIVIDDRSKKPVYTIKTEGPTTRITRNISAPTQFCTVKWPKVLPTVIKGKMVSDGVSIHLGDARWIGGENLLQRGVEAGVGPFLIFLFSSRKFQLPNYSQQLKWKRHGNVCWCTTTTVAGPVAILELARDRVPTRLTVYETLHDKYDTKGVLSYHGVYIPLIDYLLVTAMLLVTDLQEWMLVTQVEGRRNIIVPNPTAGNGETVETTTSDVQWRKILYREPLFPRINGEASSSHTEDSESAISPTTPVSARNGHNRVYSQPGSLPAGASILSFSDDGYEHDERSTVRPLSPAMESQYYPGDEAPRHSYADPSYHYRKSVSAVPPVPPLPVEYQMSNRSLPIPLPSPSSPARPLRKLPIPPPIREGHLTSDLLHLLQEQHQHTHIRRIRHPLPHGQPCSCTCTKDTIDVKRSDGIKTATDRSSTITRSGPCPSSQSERRASHRGVSCASYRFL